MLRADPKPTNPCTGDNFSTGVIWLKHFSGNLTCAQAGFARLTLGASKDNQALLNNEEKTTGSFACMPYSSYRHMNRKQWEGEVQVKHCCQTRGHTDPPMQGTELGWVPSTSVQEQTPSTQGNLLLSSLPHFRHQCSPSQHKKKKKKGNKHLLPTPTCIHMHEYFGKTEESVDGGVSARFKKNY